MTVALHFWPRWREGRASRPWRVHSAPQSETTTHGHGRCERDVHVTAGDVTGYRPELAAASSEDEALQAQIERLETLLLRLGTKHEARYAKKERSILDGLQSSDTTQFEIAHRDLGEMLGFEAGRHESDASPDPWWISGKYCLVFEDHSGADAKSALGADKARQADGHPKWMRANAAMTHVTEATEIQSVLVTPVTRAESGAFPHLGNVALWPLEEFRTWAREALGVVRQLRRSMGDDCDLGRAGRSTLNGAACPAPPARLELSREFARSSSRPFRPSPTRRRSESLDSLAIGYPLRPRP
jgi:hypothetical protein